MNNAVIIDFTTYRKERFTNQPPTLSVSEELIIEIKKLIARLKTCETITSRHQPVLHCSHPSSIIS